VKKAGWSGLVGHARYLHVFFGDSTRQTSSYLFQVPTFHFLPNYRIFLFFIEILQNVNRNVVFAYDFIRFYLICSEVMPAFLNLAFLVGHLFHFGFP
jgi:hypothetical protein